VVKLASVSVDLDSLPLYCRIHGLPESILDDGARRLIYRTALPRCLELFSNLSIRATLFAVGQDLDREGRAALQAAHRGGCEVANHSYAHDYALTRQTDASISTDIKRAAEAIEAATGERPAGYRAPGYALSAPLYQALVEQGYRYDSSAFPAAPYYAAKALVMMALALIGRRSRATLDHPRVLLAPREPYFPDPANPYRRGKGTLLELPIATSPVGRFPLIGTLVCALPSPVLQPLYRTMRQANFLNFQLHAVDLLDREDGIPAELARQQRDLNVPHRLKISRLDTVLRWLQSDFSVLPLVAAAKEIAPVARAEP
jgi:peptidoglycan/xylan/chitin deacetylase (PgdA/CDA1 family)